MNENTVRDTSTGVAAVGGATLAGSMLIGGRKAAADAKLYAAKEQLFKSMSIKKQEGARGQAVSKQMGKLFKPLQTRARFAVAGLALGTAGAAGLGYDSWDRSKTASEQGDNEAIGVTGASVLGTVGTAALSNHFTKERKIALTNARAARVERQGINRKTVKNFLGFVKKDKGYTTVGKEIRSLRAKASEVVKSNLDNAQALKGKAKTARNVAIGIGIGGGLLSAAKLYKETNNA